MHSVSKEADGPALSGTVTGTELPIKDAKAAKPKKDASSASADGNENENGEKGKKTCDKMEFRSHVIVTRQDQLPDGPGRVAVTSQGRKRNATAKQTA